MPMMEGPLRVAMIGFGAIGNSFAQMIYQAPASHIDIVGVLVNDASKHPSTNNVSICSSVDVLLDRRPEVVVEAAGHAALRAYGPAILRSSCDLLLVSGGALADQSLLDEMISAAFEGNAQIRLASGAIGGLDALAAAATGGLWRVTHTTRKPAASLLDAKEASELTSAKEIFRGSARAGALMFPESINVAAAVSLAGIGFDRTEVSVVADPNVIHNQHEVVAEGAFGLLELKFMNVPSEQNPRSAKLAAMSLVHMLVQRRARLWIG